MALSQQVDAFTLEELAIVGKLTERQQVQYLLKATVPADAGKPANAVRICPQPDRCL